MVELTAPAFSSAIGNWKSAMTSRARGSRQDDSRLGRPDCKDVILVAARFGSRSAGRGRPGPRLGTQEPTVGSVALVEYEHRERRDRLAVAICPPPYLPERVKSECCLKLHLRWASAQKYFGRKTISGVKIILGSKR